jgi:hypothetical protein
VPATDLPSPQGTCYMLYGQVCGSLPLCLQSLKSTSATRSFRSRQPCGKQCIADIDNVFDNPRPARDQNHDYRLARSLGAYHCQQHNRLENVVGGVLAEHQWSCESQSPIVKTHEVQECIHGNSLDLNSRL